jgi:tetratricopeptide (TPR) repeat protein
MNFPWRLAAGDETHMACANRLFSLALEHHRAGRLEQAEAYYRELLETVPDHADALHLLGLVAYQGQRHEAAVELIRKAIQLNGAFAPFHCNLGAAYRALGRSAEAVQCYLQAIRLDRQWVDPHYNLGNVYNDDGRLDEAIESYQNAIALDPNCADAHNQLGDVLKRVGRLEKAVESHQRAIAIRAHFPEAHFHLGNALKRLGRTDLAEGAYRRAIEQRTDYVEAHVNLGFVLEDQCRFDEAVASYDRAIELNPECADARFNRSLALLRVGDFARGWSEYEWRPARRSMPSGERRAEWNGETARDATILVRGEQGIGDEIMFASCLPDLISQCRRCIVECEPRLVPLFQRSFPSAVIRSREMQTLRTSDASCRRDDADYEVMLASLPRHLRTSEAAFPKRGGHLVPEPAMVARWRARFDALGDGLKVGISWRGGKDEQIRQARSTTLDQWSDLFATAGIHLINLQYGATAEELERAEATFGIDIHDWDDTNPLLDLDDFAAQVAVLDLVISVDNSTVHMAGALGVPTWVLLPLTSDWRWLVGRYDSPWYPSIRLFRQTRARDWQSTFHSAAGALRRFISLQPAAICTPGPVSCEHN